MQLYFIDIDDGERDYKDEEGADYPDAETARQEMVKTLAEVVLNALPDGNHRTFTGVVRNSSGKDVFRAELRLRSGWVDENNNPIDPR